MRTLNRVAWWLLQPFQHDRAWVVDIDGRRHTIALLPGELPDEVSGVAVDGSVHRTRRTQRFVLPRGMIYDHAFNIGRHECSLRATPGFLDGEIGWAVFVDGEVGSARLRPDEQRAADLNWTIRRTFFAVFVAAAIVAAWQLGPGWIEAFNRAPL